MASIYGGVISALEAQRRREVFKRYFIQSKLFLTVATSFIMILAGLSACAGQTTAPTFTNPNPIVIGTSLSFTKDFASDGQAMAQGYQLWADAVNNNGGLLGRQVKLDILHDDSSEAMVTNNYKTLIKQKVDFLFGPFSSLLTKAALDAPGISKYAFIEGAGGTDSVFQKAQQGHANLFDVSLPVDNNLITFAYYILSLPKQERPTTAAYLTSDDPFTFPQVYKAEALLEQAGVKTLYVNQYTELDGTKATLDKATADIKQLIQKQAQVVILGTLLPDIQLEVQLFKNAHYNPKAMIATAGPDAGQDFIKAVGGYKYADGVFVPNGWYPQANNYQNAAMVQAYITQYHVIPDQINADVAEAYSVGQVLEQAVDKLQSTDNAKIIALMQGRTVFNTVQGTAQFDPATASDAGQNVQAIAYLFQWQGNQFIPVYPYSAAMENPEPKPASY
jgi:branched-chain amino acid transport system substrate-binding protein